MKRFIAFLNRRLASETLTPGIRFLAWIFALVNIPGVVLAFVAWFFLPLTIPGLILYVNYWRIALDKVSRSSARATWMGTALYNLALPFVFWGMSERFSWEAMLGYSLIASIAMIAWYALRESEFTRPAESSSTL